MSAPEENFEEHDLTGVPEDLQFQEKGHNDELVVGAVGKRWPGWPGETVFRILVPAEKIGGIIGRKGEFIKKMCEESRARIKILDGPPGLPEKVVMVSAKEEKDASIPPAVDGLLRVHKHMVDGLDNNSAHAPPSVGGLISTKLLVPASRTGTLIGKQGAVVKSIQEASNVIISVHAPEDLSVFALQDDKVVEVQGEPKGVHKAIELIASRLRKFLVDRSVLPLFEMNMCVPNSHMNPSMPHPSWGGDTQGFPNAGGSGFGDNSHFMPPRQHDNYYPLDFPSLDKQPRQGPPSFGRDAPTGIHPSTNAQLPAPIIKQVTQHMQIPLAYADAVIGTAGANISYIRRASGATITIQESKGMPGEMTVEINGTATEVQTAQQLIQNVMAQAAGSTQNPTVSEHPGQLSYQSHGSTYTSPPSNAGNAAGHAGGGYGPVYGTNYGY